MNLLGLSIVFQDKETANQDPILDTPIPSYKLKLTHEWTHLDERAGTMNQVLQYMCWSNSQQGYSHASILCHQCDWIVRPVLAELNTVHISCEFIIVQVARYSDKAHPMTEL